MHLNQILQHNDYHITENSVIYVYFHRFQNPIARTSDGNHFAYMDPVSSIHNQDDNLQSNFSFQYPSYTQVRDPTLYTACNRQSQSKSEKKINIGTNIKCKKCLV